MLESRPTCVRPKPTPGLRLALVQQRIAPEESFHMQSILFGAASLAVLVVSFEVALVLEWVALRGIFRILMAGLQPVRRGK